MQDQWRRQAQLHLNPASDLAVSTDVTVARTLCSSPPGRSPSPAQYNASTNPQGTGQNNLQFQVWQRDGTGSPDPTLQIQSNEPSNRPTVKRSSNASIMNQVSKVAGPLLRRQSLSALELLKEADSTYQKEAAKDVSNETYDLKFHQICEEPRTSHVKVLLSHMENASVVFKLPLIILTHFKYHKLTGVLVNLFNLSRLYMHSILKYLCTSPLPL